MALSVYVHIPYCLQRCRYCDFTTFEWTEILPPERYVAQVLQEIRLRRKLWSRHDELATLYFGGGTPSLIEPDLIVAICRELANCGFRFQDQAEITIEINPATLSQRSLDTYLRAGINRFSVGAQTFNDDLLTKCGRRHTAEDTRATLKLLQGRNYSFDLLFALPGQTTQDLARDLDEVSAFSPPHLSAYCLTVPSGHPMALGRPPEDKQVQMFHQIESHLQADGLEKYEISNFAKRGLHSRHNSVYWNDNSYWGIGLSSHSYDRDAGAFGMRFWNPKSTAEYARQATHEAASFSALLPEEQWELLKEHESLTDFCHMFLRTSVGLPKDALQKKFSPLAINQAKGRLERLRAMGLLHHVEGFWRLSQQGQLVSNKVFEELTFLAHDLGSERLTGSKADTYCSV